MILFIILSIVVNQTTEMTHTHMIKHQGAFIL